MLLNITLHFSYVPSIVAAASVYLRFSEIVLILNTFLLFSDSLLQCQDSDGKFFFGKYNYKVNTCLRYD